MTLKPPLLNPTLNVSPLVIPLITPIKMDNSNISELSIFINSGTLLVISTKKGYRKVAIIAPDDCSIPKNITLKAKNVMYSAKSM